MVARSSRSSVGVFAVLALWAFAMARAQAQEIKRGPSEDNEQFAGRALHLSADPDMHVRAAIWNTHLTLFVDYKTPGGDDYSERPLVALQQQTSGAYQAINVTVGEQEGGTPDVAAIGFANADKHRDKELIVIFSWPQVLHYDFSGTIYEVRIFHMPIHGETTLVPMKISDHFGSECDCDWRDGTRKRFRFKTIAAVKVELKRMGF